MYLYCFRKDDNFKIGITKSLEQRYVKLSGVWKSFNNDSWAYKCDTPTLIRQVESHIKHDFDEFKDTSVVQKEGYTEFFTNEGYEIIRTHIETMLQDRDDIEFIPNIAPDRFKVVAEIQSLEEARKKLGDVTKEFNDIAKLVAKGREEIQANEHLLKQHSYIIAQSKVMIHMSTRTLKKYHNELEMSVDRAKSELEHNNDEVRYTCEMIADVKEKLNKANTELSHVKRDIKTSKQELADVTKELINVFRPEELESSKQELADIKKELKSKKWEKKVKLTKEQVNRRKEAINTHFAECGISGYIEATQMSLDGNHWYLGFNTWLDKDIFGKLLKVLQKNGGKFDGGEAEWYLPANKQVIVNVATAFRDILETYE